MKYLFFRALLFYFVLFFNLLYFQSTWKSFLITNIECLGFLKCVRIGSHGIPFKKKKISKNSDIGDFYQRILINWYYLLCLLSSTVFRNSIVFFFTSGVQQSLLLFLILHPQYTVCDCHYSCFGDFFGTAPTTVRVFAHWTQMETLQIPLHQVSHP